MDEGRKRVLLIAASIIAARKLAPHEGPGALRTPAVICAIDDAIHKAEQILKEIDGKWPDSR